MNGEETASESDNYVWSTAKILQYGTMGNVYIGRRKVIGKKCAVKVCNNEIIKCLKQFPPHRNIVHVIAIEEQKRSNDKALILELCEGSLNEILAKSENYFGLLEDEFLLVLFHIGDALRYLHNQHLIHGDIKPGNILLSLLSDDRHIYKLANFGTQNCYTVDGRTLENVTGTLEYMHPKVHKSIFLNKEACAKYDLYTELWSFGVTLYQCATGTLPFMTKCVQNHLMMQKLLEKRKAGVISQREEADGSISSSKHLTGFCHLTRDTKMKVEELLEVIFNLTKPEDFFNILHVLEAYKRIHVLDALNGSMLTVYLKASARLCDVKYELNRLTKVSVDEQSFLWEMAFLNNDDEKRPISKWLRTSEEKPLVMISRTVRMKLSDGICIRMQRHVIDQREFTADVLKWTRERCGIVHYMKAVIERSALMINHTSCTERIVRALSSQLERFNRRCMSIIYEKVSMLSGPRQINMLKQVNKNLLTPIQVTTSERSWNFTGGKAEKLAKDAEECFTKICTLTGGAGDEADYRKLMIKKLHEIYHDMRQEYNTCFHIIYNIICDLEKSLGIYFSLVKQEKILSALMNSCIRNGVNIK